MVEVIVGIAFFALFVLSLSTMLSWVASVSWLTELFSHFTLQYAIGALVLAIFFKLAKKREYSWLCLFLFLYHSFFLLPFLPWKPVYSNAENKVTLLQFNVYKFNQNNDKIINWLKAEKFDIVNLQEVNGDLAEWLKSLKEEYPYQLIEPRDDSFGTALLSKKPFLVARNIALDGADSYNHYIVAQIDLGKGKALDIYAIHAMSPIAENAADERDRQLLAVASVVRKDVLPTKIMIGDFNLTPYSPHFSKLLDKSGLRNSMVGFGIQNSWTSDFPFWFLRIPIDHVLVGDGVEVLDRKVLPDSLGSDHFPVVVELDIK